jgi:hypothetical protein
VAAVAAANPAGLIGEGQPAWTPEDWQKEFPGNWPPLSAEEKNLLRIPLDRAHAIFLLQYKLNHHVFDNEGVVGELKDRKIWPHKGPIDLPVAPGSIGSGLGHLFMHDKPTNAKEIMDVFYGHILDQYEKKNDWDKNFREERTVGSVWRRFWEQASNRAYEENFKSQLKPYLAHPGGPSTYPEEAKQKLKQDADGNRTFLGDGNVRRMQDYVAANLDKASRLPHTDDAHLNNDNVAFAKLTRGGPQLNFPAALANCHIDPALLKITRDDLKHALGMNDKDIDMALSNLPAPSTNWAQRASEVSGSGKSLP